jgi:hypothetical protein
MASAMHIKIEDQKMHVLFLAQLQLSIASPTNISHVLATAALWVGPR